MLKVLSFFKYFFFLFTGCYAIFMTITMKSDNAIKILFSSLTKMKEIILFNQQPASLSISPSDNGSPSKHQFTFSLSSHIRQRHHHHVIHSSEFVQLSHPVNVIEF